MACIVNSHEAVFPALLGDAVDYAVGGCDVFVAGVGGVVVVGVYEGCDGFAAEPVAVIVSIPSVVHDV